MPNQPHALRAYCNSREYQRLRRALLDRQVICVVCQTRFATELDHRLPLRLGGNHDPANLQALCHPCHKAKTAAENRSHPVKRKPKMSYNDFAGRRELANNPGG